MPKNLYHSFSGAMAYIEVKLPNGDIKIGSSFHIGDGVFITARHVIENKQILSMATTERSRFPDEKGNTTIAGESSKYNSVFGKELTISSGPFFHPDSGVDVAALIVEQKDMTVVPLGQILNDWIADSEFIMHEVLVMGYPPIPFSRGPLLVSAKGEINTVLDKRKESHPYFIISAMPRGGFSGGLCAIDMPATYGEKFALGVIVDSLVMNNRDTELGFMAVLTVEPIYKCLQHHKITPKNQMDWGEDI